MLFAVLASFQIKAIVFRSLMFMKYSTEKQNIKQQNNSIKEKNSVKKRKQKIYQNISIIIKTHRQIYIIYRSLSIYNILKYIYTTIT